MTRWGYLEITRTCIGCGAALPVNGPLEQVRCASCFTVNPVPMVVHDQVLEIVEEGIAHKAAGDALTTQTPLTEGGIYRLTWGLRAPRCGECGTDLSDCLAAHEDFPCPGCGVNCTSFVPTGLYARLFPSVRQVVLGERPPEGVEESQQQVTVDQSGTSPILMSCDGCGGSLSITTATPRLHGCEYCGVLVGIPPDLWMRLHPAESTRGWYVRLEGPLMKMTMETREEVGRLYMEQSLGEAEHAAGPSRWAKIQLVLECVQCSEHVPVNGPLPHVICGNCDALIEIPSDHHVGFLSWVDGKRPYFDGTVLRKGYRYQMKCTRVPPVCSVCDTPLPLMEPGVEAEIQCTGCTARHRTFPVPPDLAEKVGRARQLYCARKEPDPPPSRVPAQLDFSCTSCGAEQTITPETGRIHRCQYCQSDVFIPDELWTRFHPVTRVRSWYVDAVTEPSRPPKSTRPPSPPEHGETGAGTGSEDMVAKRNARVEREARWLNLVFYVVVGAAVLAGLLIWLFGEC